MATVELDRVAKAYQDGTRAVDGVTLTVADGELVALTGPPGCGKSTLLRLVAGLEAATEGRLLIGGRVVNRVPARDRDVAMVFQGDALYPHLDVFDNIAFGLRLRGRSADEVTAKVQAVARALGLGAQLHRRPPELSGGQCQLVAVARAIVRRPSVLLLDEPPSNVDPVVRGRLRMEIARTNRSLRTTTIVATHDQAEAMTLGHRVAVMRAGRLEQVAAPRSLRDEPASLFIAAFIGSPAMNLLKAVLVTSPEPALILGEQRLALPTGLLTRRPALARYVDRPVAVGIRPEDIAGPIGPGPVPAYLMVTAGPAEPTGTGPLVHCGIDAEPVDPAGEAAATGGEPSRARTGLLAPIACRLSSPARISGGERVRVAVDTERLHLFDLDSGQAIR